MIRVAHLSIKQRRIVIDVGDFHGERADTLEARLALICRLHGDRHELAVVAFAIEDLVGRHLAGFLVDSEFRALLVRLLHNRVLHLTVDAFVLVRRLHFDHRAAVRRALLHLRVIRSAVLEHRLVVIDVGDEHHDDGGRCVYRGFAVDTTRAVIQRCHIQLVLIAIQRDAFAVQPDYAGNLLNHKLSAIRAAADKAESDVVAVLVGRDDRRHQRVGSGVLVDVWRVDLLRELRLLVVLVLRVDANGGGSSLGRLALVLGGDREFVVSVVVVGVELLVVDDDAVGVDCEVVVRHQVFDLSVGAGIGVHRLHLEDAGAERNVLVDVVCLVVGQLEFRSVVVDVGDADRELKIIFLYFFNLKIFALNKPQPKLKIRQNLPSLSLPKSKRAVVVDPQSQAP